MAVEEVSSGEGDVEMEVPSGSSAARPPEVPKAPQLLSGTGTEGITDAEMMELRIIMDEDWSPPYRSPPAVWSCHGPLEHNQTGYFDFCLLCGKWLSQGHLQSDSHMRQMERWLRADKPALAIPHDRFMDHERLEMLIQARHPLWSSNMVLSAKERVLQMEFFEASGETRLIVAPGLKLLYPLRYDASLLDGAKALEGFVPPLDEERFRELHLPYVPGGGPSKEWVREHGGTPRCPGCSEEATSSRHSVRCVRRYQRWLRDAVDNALEELDRDPPPAQGPPAKRVRFGDSEVREFSAPSAPSEGEVEVPQIDVEANDHLSDYEPSLPSEDEGEDDLMGVAEAPKDDRPAIRLLEELWACGCVRYVPTPLTACDVYDLQAFCSLLVDGRSSCDKLPYSCIASLGNVEHEHVEHDVGRLSLGVPVGRSSVSVPVGRSSVDASVGRSGVSMSVGRSDQSACNGQDQEREGAYMPFGDRWVWVSRPRVSYDDIDGIQLDNKESWEGMKTEVKAVDSLQVGLLRSRSEVDHYQAENPGCRVIKSRWVLTQKAPGLVRARLVAKDFAHGRPSALDLGLSANTASVEALKLILSRAAKCRMRIWGLDISTAFLFANVVQPTVVELPSSVCLEGGGTAYLILEKALYGLRSASLSWQRHLSKIMVGLGLKASPLEPTLFSGWVQLGQKWTYIIALARMASLSF